MYPELVAPGSGVSADGRWSHSFVAPLIGVIVSTLVARSRLARRELGADPVRQLANDSRSCGVVGQG